MMIVYSFGGNMSYKDFTIGLAIENFGIIELIPKSEEYNVFCNEFMLDTNYKCTDAFMEDLKFSLERYYKVKSNSESWLRENFISIFLRETWKNHRKLHIWQGSSLNVDVDKGLTGEPDYYVTKVAAIPKAPYCIIGEAKKGIIEDTWGQCLAAMKGAQILNEKAGIDIPIYGIITSGLYWQFGKLVKDTFAIYPEGFLSVFDYEREILKIMDQIFTKCEEYIQE